MFWKVSNCTRLKARAIFRTFKTSLLPINHESYSRSCDFLYPTGFNRDYFINNYIYYPTAFSRVQITRETSTNIPRYLYSTKPVCDICTPENLFDGLAAFMFFERSRVRGSHFTVVLLRKTKINTMLSPLPLSVCWFRNDTWHRHTLLGSSRTHQTSRLFFTESPKSSLSFLSFFTVLTTVTLHKIHQNKILKNGSKGKKAVCQF